MKNSLTGAGLCCLVPVLFVFFWCLFLGGCGRCLAEENPTPAASVESVEAAPAKVITLAECVALALRQNTSIKLAYMDRVVQRYTYETATRYPFRPVIGVQTGVFRSGTEQTVPMTGETSRRAFSGTISGDQRLPTGGRIGVQWYPQNRESNSQTIQGASAGVSSRLHSWRLGFSQPLGKGAGTGIGTMDIREARIRESLDQLNLKSTVMDTVTAVILAYRQFLQSRWDVEINRSALERAKTLLATNTFLISMGRMAAQDIIQSESDLANRELGLEIAKNSYDQARLNLLRLLDLSRDTRVEPVEKLEIPEFSFTEEEVLQKAKQHQPAWLSMVQSLEWTRLHLFRARNDQKLDISLSGSIGANRTRGDKSVDMSGSDWEYGVVLNLPVYGTTRRDLRQTLLAAETEMKKGELNLRKTGDNLAIVTRDKVRQIHTLEKQIKLAEKALNLSERKLEVENIKLKAGKSTNFQIVSYQDELRTARINELSVKIAYLNALSDLDQFMGTVHLTWGIDIAASPDSDPASEKGD